MTRGSANPKSFSVTSAENGKNTLKVCRKQRAAHKSEKIVREEKTWVLVVNVDQKKQYHA